MSYNIGKLKNFIYLITDISYQVSDYKVYLTKGDVYKLQTDLTTFSETENYAGRFQFNTTVTCTLNRIIDDSLFRQKNFYIVVEDYNGLQFIVSPEFPARFTSELTINESITNVLTFNTQSNIPTRILASKIVASQVSGNICQYTGIGIKDLFIGQNEWYKVEYLTAEYTKTFNGSYDTIQLTFTYPIADNDYHYDLINFPDNRWNIRIDTPDDEVREYSLFPQYNRQNTDTTGRFSITLRGTQQGLQYGTSGQEKQYRWVPSSEYICDGFNKYVKDVQQVYASGLWVNTGEFKKGELVERNSEDCGYSDTVQYRWVTVAGYVCDGVNKYQKQKQQKSTDGGATWQDTGVERSGDLIENDSIDCGYEAAEWKEVEGEYICEEYDPSVSWVLLSDEYYCKVVTV